MFGQYADSKPIVDTTKPTNAIDARIIAFIEKPTRNVKSAGRLLFALEENGYDTSDAHNALEEYTDIVRADYDDSESYRDDKDEAWYAFLDELTCAEREEED